MGFVRIGVGLVFLLALLSSFVLAELPPFEEQVFDWYFYRFEDGKYLDPPLDVDGYNTATSDVTVAPDVRTKTTIPIQTYLPYDTSQTLTVYYRTKLIINLEGNLTFKNNFTRGTTVILKKAEDGTTTLLMASKDTGCPGNNPSTGVNYPFCVYDRDGNLIYSWRTGAKGINSYASGLSVSGWRTRCPYWSGSPDNTALNCGTATPSVHVYLGDEIYFSDDRDLRIEGWGSGMRLTAFGTCDNYQTTDYDTDAGKCYGCPYTGGGSGGYVGAEAGNRSWSQEVSEIASVQPQACCGDDSYENGWVVTTLGDDGRVNDSRYLCARNSAGKFDWYDATAHKGTAVPIVYAFVNSSILSNGTTWARTCGPYGDGYPEYSESRWWGQQPGGMQSRPYQLAEMGATTNPYHLPGIGDNDLGADYLCLTDNASRPDASTPALYSCGCPQDGCGDGTTRLRAGEAVKPNHGWKIQLPNITALRVWQCVAQLGYQGHSDIQWWLEYTSLTTNTPPRSNCGFFYNTTLSMVYPPNYLDFKWPLVYPNLPFPYYDSIFCTDHNTFAANLDGEEVTCDSARVLNPRLNISWTGNKCCGDLRLGSYNDPGGDGACYLGEPHWNGNFDGAFQDQKLNVQNGTIYACDPGARLNPYNSSAILKDEQGKDVVKITSTCVYDSASGLYCDTDGIWKNPESPETPPLKNSTVPASWIAAQPLGCCTDTTCWNGSVCFEDQTNNTLSPAPRGDGYRCIAGNWSLSFPKTEQHSAPLTQEDPTPLLGWCPHNNQCLFLNTTSVDPNYPIQPTSLQCVASGQYFDDDYCANGSWSTRTKLVALAMLKTVGAEDFTIYCGPAETTLGYFDSSIGAANNIQSLPGLLSSFNNICVLQKGSSYLIGLSYNGNFTDAKNSLSPLFPTFSICTPGSGLTACGQKGWVDAQNGFVIASSIPVVYTIRTADPEGAFITPHAGSLFETLPTAKPSFSYAFKSDGLNLNWLYVQRKNGKTAFATIDEGTLLALYTPPDLAKQKLCDAITALQFRKLIVIDYAGPSDVACVRDSTKVALIAFGSKDGPVDPYHLWPDTSGRLRLP